MNNGKGHDKPIPQHESKTEIAEQVDIEAHGRAGKTPPPARIYRIRIDDHHYTTEKNELTGREILALASKRPEAFTLRQRLHGGRVESIGPDALVNLLTPGLERFITIPKENTEGEVSPSSGESDGSGAASCLQRNFALPEGDTEYLEANHPAWESILETQTPYVILRGFKVPPGYNHTQVDAAVLISAGYPATHLDMVYFHPHLARADGRPIRALATQTIEGKPWQRWSRHYTWRAGIDNLSIHVERIKSWLENELHK